LEIENDERDSNAIFSFQFSEIMEVWGGNIDLNMS
jgi:hypothetical protein